MISHFENEPASSPSRSFRLGFTTFGGEPDLYVLTLECSADPLGCTEHHLSRADLLGMKDPFPAVEHALGHLVYRWTKKLKALLLEKPTEAEINRLREELRRLVGRYFPHHAPQSDITRGFHIALYPQIGDLSTWLLVLWSSLLPGYSNEFHFKTHPESVATARHVGPQHLANHVNDALQGQNLPGLTPEERVTIEAASARLFAIHFP